VWTGRQLTTFNSEAQVLIGGKKDTMGHLVRPFRGTIAGASLCRWLSLSVNHIGLYVHSGLGRKSKSTLTFLSFQRTKLFYSSFVSAPHTSDKKAELSQR